MPPAPSSERLRAQRVDHPHRVRATLGGSVTPNGTSPAPGGGARAGANSHAPAGVDRLTQEPSWWVEAFRTRVHLDRDVLFAACSDHAVGVEGRLGAPASDHD